MASSAMYVRGGAMFGLAAGVSFAATSAARLLGAPAAAVELSDARAAAPSLAARGVRMYGAESSVWTRRVQADFGRSFDAAVEYVRCDTEAGADACEAAGVTVLPSWDFRDGGGVTAGYMSPGALARRLEEYHGDR